MKFLVTGANGQLGKDVISELKQRGIEAVGIDVYILDITDENAVLDFFGEVKPDVVVHCAAWTAVDAAEEEENKQKVYNVNVKGTEYISHACAELDAKLVYISTDYVFDGKGTDAWQPDDKCNPLNFYGKTKYQGELAVQKYLSAYFIVRIAWVYGKNGTNFVKTMLKIGKKRNTITVVDDQIGTPTYTFDLARLLVDMSLTDKYGKYHVTNEGNFISWYDFAKEIFSIANDMGYDYSSQRLAVLPVSSSAYPVKAKRPANSRLDKNKLIEQGFKPLPEWKDALKRFIHSLDLQKDI